ncbi:TonB-dependent receptor plug domain-containing protein [Lysobacter brunescens]|uniref:TonB-dependent receptor plug domain-containing protein n=1 Tax=Lysobacter brunescens TaxID=262323 RepID=A0ABW2YHC4_9GAMM
MTPRNTSVLRRQPLSAAILTTLLLSGASFAQDTSTNPLQDEQAPSGEQQNLDKIVVTGSRIKRAEVEGPTPVTIVTAAEIEKQGFGTVYDALNSLSQFTGSVQNELNQNGFTPNASFLNLRGLGPGYQLVLINGRRTADYPLPYNSQSNAVNLANIPAAAISRIEVLSGGASAIYGSDAVAGVVNVILKTNFEGDEFDLRAGTTTQGGGDSVRLQWVGGKTGDQWSATYAVEYLEREEIFASQRDFMDSYRDDPTRTPNSDLPVEAIALRNLSAGGTRIWPNGVAANCEGTFGDFESFTVPSAPSLGELCGYYGFPATQQIRNADSNLNGYFYGTYDFANGMQAFAQVSLSQADAKIASGTQFWSSASDSTFDNAAFGTRGVFFAQNLGAYVDAQRIFTPSEVGGVGSQQTRIRERSIDVAAGLRGTLFDNRFDWEASLSHARYDLESRQPRFLANGIRDYFAGPRLGTDANGFGVYNLNLQRYFSPLGVDAFRSMTTQVKTEADSSVTQGGFTLSGDLFELPAGAVGMAAVVEFASQQYDLDPDARILPGYAGTERILNLSGGGGGGERDRYAVGVEFSIPVLSTLNLNLAGRYDRYDDVTNVDGAATWSAGVEWRPVSNLLLRANHATSFRAPDMHYVFATDSGFFTNVFDEYRCRRDGGNPTSTACTSNANYAYEIAGTRSGSRDLEEEKGESTTVGVVWDIVDNLSVSVDWYRIKLEGGVSDINTGYLLRNEADCLLGQRRDGTPVNGASAECLYFTGLVNRVGTGPLTDNQIGSYRSFPINQAMTRTSGIDATARYRLDTDRLGNFDFNLSWTHVLKLEDELFSGSGVRDLRDNRQFTNQRSRLNWGANWERGDWLVNVNGYRYGSLPNWAETGRIAPYIVWNAGVQKRITDKATIGLAVQNLLDKTAPRDESFNAYPYFWNSYSPIGREVFVSFNYKFD